MYVRTWASKSQNTMIIGATINKINSWCMKRSQFYFREGSILAMKLVKRLSIESYQLYCNILIYIMYVFAFVNL